MSEDKSTSKDLSEKVSEMSIADNDTPTSNKSQVAQQVQNQQQQLSKAKLKAQAKRLGYELEPKKHTFWNTQPMPQVDIEADQSNPPMHNPIIPNKPKSALRQDPYNMPKGFEWSDIDILDPNQLNEVYNLLTANYVEDDDAMFRFDYSPAFLTWALTPPGFTKECHLGVRSSKTGRLMGLITGVPATVRVYDKVVPMVEINFLCVHKKLRSKRLAPVLIKEMTRRVNHQGVFQAVYTAGVVLPVPVSNCQYFHRSIEPKKLVEVGFSRLSARMTMARMQKLYRLPTAPVTPGLRLMTKEDVPSAHKLLTTHLKKYDLVVHFTQDEFAHWLLPRDGVIRSYVAVSEETGEVTDFCSFYYLPSSVINNPKHSVLNAAYSFYNVATSVELKVLMKDCLILAKQEDQDVFNALTLMENKTVLEELKFAPGDGNLKYYLYNWACPEIQDDKIGIVLL